MDEKKTVENIHIEQRKHRFFCFTILYKALKAMKIIVVSLATDSILSLTRFDT